LLVFASAIIKKNLIFHGPMAQWDGMPGLGLDDAALPEGREPASRRSTPSAAPGGTILGGFLGGNRGDFIGLNGDLMILMLIAL